MLTTRVCSIILGVLLLSVTVRFASAEESRATNSPAEAIWISTLDVSRIEQGWGEGRSDRSVINRRLTVAGRIFQRGIGTHAHSITRVAGNFMMLKPTARN